MAAPQTTRFAGNSHPVSGVLVFPLSITGTEVTVLASDFGIRGLLSTEQLRNDIEILKEWAYDDGRENCELSMEVAGVKAENLKTHHTLSEPIQAKQDSSLYNALVKNLNNGSYVGFVLVSPVPVPPIVPMGFVLLSQVRWLTSQRVIIYMCAVSAAAYVLIVLVDGGIRIKASQVPFAGSSFGRALAWALFVSGMTVLTMAVVHSGATTSKKERNITRVVDNPRLA